MNHTHISTLFRTLLAVGLTGGALLAQAQTVDVVAAEKLISDSKCLKCHSVDKKKDGPSFKVTAAKYKGKADAEAKLVTHVTSGPTIEIDGVKEEHIKIKSKDDAAIKNAVHYILSR